MTKPRKRLPSQSSVRWDDDLQPLVLEWLEKNPDWNISQLANQAIRKFILSHYLRLERKNTLLRWNS